MAPTTARERGAGIFYYLSRSTTPVSSEGLADLLGVSSRTIKASLSAARKYAFENGARLESLRGVGHWLSVEDRAAHAAALTQLAVQQAVSPVHQGAGVNHSIRALQWILDQPASFTLGAMSAATFASQGVLRQDLPRIRSHLEDYNLTLTSSTGGYRLDGAEFHRRLCLVSLLASPYHYAEALYDPGSNILPFDRDRYHELRHQLLHSLRRLGLHFMDERSQLMAQYLYLSVHRHQRGYRVAIGPEDAAHLHEGSYYRLAHDILTELESAQALADDEAEVLGLEMLLLAWSDRSSVMGSPGDEDLLGSALPTMTRRACSLLNEFYGVELWDEAAAAGTIHAALATILFQVRFGMARMNRASAVLYRDRFGKSPVAIGAASYVTLALEEEFDTTLGDTAPMALGSRVACTINALGLTYVPRRVALCTTSGLDAADAMRIRVLKIWGEAPFETIDIYELYELRGIEQARYDVVVLDYPEFSYRYDWPHVSLRQGWPGPRTAEFEDVVIAPGWRLRDVAASISCSIQVFRGFKPTGIAALLELLAMRHGRTPTDVEQLRQLFTKQLLTTLFAGICTLVVSPEAQAAEAFEIYELAEAIPLWPGTDVTHVVLIAVRFDGNPDLLRLVEEAANIISTRPEALASLIDHPTPERLARLVEQGILGH